MFKAWIRLFTSVTIYIRSTRHLPAPITSAEPSTTNVHKTSYDNRCRHLFGTEWWWGAARLFQIVHARPNVVNPSCLRQVGDCFRGCNKRWTENTNVTKMPRKHVALLRVFKHEFVRFPINYRRLANIIWPTNTRQAVVERRRRIFVKRRNR